MHLSFQKIDRAIYLIIFFLPAYLIRTNIFSIPTTALEITIYLLFIIWFLGNHPRPNWLRNVRRWAEENKLLTIGIFLLLLGAAISTLLSPDFRTSAGILKGWFFDPLLFFIILISAIKTAEQKENVLKVFFASGSAVAAISLIYWFLPSLGGITYDGRLHAFYLSPNYLAMYLAPALLVGIRLMISAEKNRYGAAAVAVIALALYFTFSYAAWVSLFVAIILLLYLAARVNKKPSFQWKHGFLSGAGISLKKILFSVIAVLLIFIAAILAQSGTSKSENLKNLAYRSSYNSRLMIWRAAWKIGKDNPVFGIGPGNFQKYYLDYQKKFPEPYLEWAVPEPHNIFLAFWLQTGILGLGGFLLLLYWFFKNIIGAIKKTGNSGPQRLAIILCAIMVYILLHGMADTTYWKNDLAMIFWLLIGLASQETKYYQRHFENLEQIRYKRKSVADSPGNHIVVAGLDYHRDHDDDY